MPRYNGRDISERRRVGRPSKSRELKITSFPSVSLNLVQLIARKSSEEGRLIGPQDVINEAGVSRWVVYRTLSGEGLKEIPLSEIGKLLRYFNTTIDQLFVVGEDVQVETTEE